MPKGIPLKQSLRIAVDVDCAGCDNIIHLKRKLRSSAKSNYCRDCLDHPMYRKFIMVIRKHNFLTFEELEKLYAVENCECCGYKLGSNSGPGKTGNRTRQIDHCHETGIIRGVLCWNCNVGLGKLGDNLDGLNKAINYIKGD